MYGNDDLAIHPLHKAAREGDISSMQRLLQKTPGLLKTKALYGRRPLHCAAEGGHVEAIDLLLKFESNRESINEKTSLGQKPFHIALRFGHIAAVIRLNFYDPNTFCNMTIEEALELAIKGGNEDCIAWVLQNKPGLTLENLFLALADAISKQSLNAVESLLNYASKAKNIAFNINEVFKKTSSNSDICRLVSDGYESLAHLCVGYFCGDIFNLLLKFGLQVSIIEQNASTSLFKFLFKNIGYSYYRLQSIIQIRLLIELLIKNSANINLTLSEEAAIRVLENADMLKTLLEFNLPFLLMPLTTSSNCNKNILHLAVAKATDPSVLALLLKYCSDNPLLKSVDTSGMNLWHYATLNLNVSSINILANYINEIDIEQKDNQGHTPLTLILEKIFDAYRSYDYDNKSKLALDCLEQLKIIGASIKKSEHKIIQLIDEFFKKSVSNSTDENEIKNLIKLLKHLEESGIPFNNLNKEKQTILHLVCRRKNEFLISEFLNAGFGIYIDCEDELGNYPYSYYSADMKLRRRVAASGSQPRNQLKSNTRKLQPTSLRLLSLIEDNKLAELKLLVEECGKEKINSLLDVKSKNKLILGDKSKTELIDDDFFSYDRDYGGKIKLEKHEIFTVKAESTAKNISLSGVTIQPTPLVYAIKNKNLDMLTYLIELGADIHKEIDGINLACVCAFFHDLASLELLVNRGLYINPSHESSLLLLQIATYHKNESIIEFLLKQGFSPEQTNNNGVNSVEIAISRNHLEVIELFLKYGLNIGYVNKRQENFLQLAAKKGHFDLVSYFLKLGLNPNHENNSGYNALTLFCKKKKNINANNIGIFFLLLQAGGKLQEKLLNDYYTLRKIFTLSIRYNHLGNAEYLLNKSLIEKEDISLLEACRENHSEMVHLLIKFGANVNEAQAEIIIKKHTPKPLSYIEWRQTEYKRNYSRNSYRSYSTYNPYDSNDEYEEYEDEEEMYDSYVQAHYDRVASSIDRYEYIETPLSLAIINGSCEITRLLLVAGADPNVTLTNTDNTTLLHLAVKKSNLNLVKLLVEYGADINAVCYKHGLLEAPRNFIGAPVRFGTVLNCLLADKLTKTKEQIILFLLQSQINIDRALHEDRILRIIYQGSKSKEVEQYFENRWQNFSKTKIIYFSIWIKKRQEVWRDESLKLDQETKDMLEQAYAEPSPTSITEEYVIDVLLEDACYQFAVNLTKAQTAIKIAFAVSPEKTIEAYSKLLQKIPLLDSGLFDFVREILLNVANSHTVDAYYKKLHFVTAEAYFVSEVIEKDQKHSLALAHAILASDYPGAKRLELQIINSHINQKGIALSFKDININAANFDQLRDLIKKSYNAESTRAFQSLNLFSATRKKEILQTKPTKKVEYAYLKVRRVSSM